MNVTLVCLVCRWEKMIVPGENYYVITVTFFYNLVSLRYLSMPMTVFVSSERQPRNYLNKTDIIKCMIS